MKRAALGAFVVILIVSAWWIFRDEPVEAPPPPPPPVVEAPTPKPVRGAPCRLAVQVRGGRVKRARIFSARAQLDIPAVVAEGGRSFTGDVPEQGRIFVAVESDDGRNAARWLTCGGDGAAFATLELPEKGPDAATLDGRCVYLDTGAPVAGAVVRGRYEAGVTSTMVSAIAGDEGEFTLSLPAGVYVFRCAKDADEGAPVRVSIDPSTRRSVDLYVEARAGVAAIVLDESGQPVGGVQVRGRPSLKSLSESFAEYTDDEGRALLMGFAPGPVTLEVHDAGRFAEAHAVAKIELPYAEAQLTLVPSPVVLDGLVRTTDGSPVEGASIEVTALDRRSPLARTTVTDPGGGFTVGGLLPGKHKIRATADGFAAAQVEMILALGTNRAALSMLPACTAELMVLPAEPALPVRISLSRPDGASWDVAGRTGEIIKVPDASGSASAFVRTVGATVKTATTVGPLCGNVMKLKLRGDDKRGAIEVLVQDGNGEAVEGSDVWIDAAGGRARTDASGRVRFDGLEPREYRVGTIDVISPKTAEVLAGQTAEVTLVVDRKRGAVRGTVVSGGGPVEGARVLASCGDSGRAGRLQDASVVARTDAGGRFSFEPREGGVCVVRAEHAAAGRSRAVTLQAGGDPATIRIESGASIEGRVVSLEDGAPVSPYTLVIRTAGSAASVETRTQYVSDGGGSFVVEDVAPGRVTLSVQGQGGRGYQELDVAAGERKTGVELRVFSRGPITGRIVSGDGEPVRARITINAGDQTVGRGGSGPDGRFSMTVPAGEPVRAYVAAQGFYPKGTPPLPLVAGGTADFGDIVLDRRGGPEEKQAGIGIMITQDPRGIRVIRFAESSPAREAGMEIGDLIVAIGGVPFGREPLMNWVVKLRGPVGTPVTLEVERGTSGAFVVTVTRRDVGLRDLPDSIP